MSFGTLSITYSDRRQQMTTLTHSIIRIGRANDNDVVLDDASVSRYHAQLVCDTSGCHIVDQGSANGTMLGGVRLTPHASQPVPVGAQLQLGSVTLRVGAAAPHGAVTAAIAASAGVQRQPSATPVPLPEAPSAPPPVVRVSLHPADLVLEAGGAGIVTLVLVNTGAVVDHYTVQVNGWEDTWLGVAPARLPLLPNEQGQMVLTFQPPRASIATAQQGVVTISIMSEEHRNVVATTTLGLIIKPFTDLALQAEPMRAVTRRRADYRVTLHNRGNSTQTYTLSARDDANQVQFAFEQPTVSVAPGQSVPLLLHAHAATRPLTGPPQMFNIQISAVPAPADGQSASSGGAQVQPQGMAQVQLVQNARLPTWVIPTAIGLVSVCAILGLMLYNTRQQKSISDTTAANAATTQARNEAFQQEQAGAAAAFAATQASQQQMANALQGEQRDAMLAQIAQNERMFNATQTAQAQAATQTVQAQAATQTVQAASIAATQTALARPTDTPTPSGTPSPTPTPTAAPPLFPGAIASPQANAGVTLPLHIEARVGTPGDQILATLSGQDGVELTSGSLPVLADGGGRGLVLGNMPTASNTLTPTNQPATLELRTLAGELLDRQTLTLLADADTQSVQLFWVSGTQLQPIEVRIPQTDRPDTATLNELLWGPPNNPPGLTTAIPRPDEVLNFSGRESDWGPRVTLRNLTITDGVATADFSQEMRAHGDNPQRVQVINEQITQTLKQFSSVSEVHITVEGAPLEP